MINILNKYNYYYTLLTKTEQYAYLKIVRAIQSLVGEVTVSLEERDILHVLNAILLDIPEFFFLNKDFQYRCNYKKNEITLRLNYLFDEKTILTILRFMEKQSDSILLAINGMTTVNKEKYIHDYIIKSTDYSKVKSLHSHEAPSLFLYHEAVCDGIAKSAKFLLERAGIYTIVVIGKGANDSSAWDSDELHAWNIVFIDGYAYHLDITYDLNLSGKNIRYDYFNLADRELSEHCFNVGVYPKCCKTATYNFKPQVINSKEELSYLLKNLNIRKGVLTFKAVGLGNCSNVLDMVENEINVSLSLCDTYTISYNKGQNIFQICVE